MVTEDQIVEVLKKIEDPELFIDIWFLGLIYKIEIDDQNVAIQMTFTSPMCPAGPELVQGVKESIEELDEVEACSVEVVFTPPWEPNEEVKGMLGFE